MRRQTITAVASSLLTLAASTALFQGGQQDGKKEPKMAPVMSTSSAAVTDGPTNPFDNDKPIYRVDCDDWATIRPSDEEIWKRLEPVEMTLEEASKLVIEQVAKFASAEHVRIRQAELVIAGKPFYQFDVYTKRFNEKKQRDIVARWEARMGIKTGEAKMILLQQRFPGTPFREEFTELPSGVMLGDVRAGDGEIVDEQSTVKVQYTVTLLNGSLIINTYSEGRPKEFHMSEAPTKGFADGLVGARVGGKRKLIVPPSMGYGDEGWRDIIPPNATIVYDIETIRVK